MAATYWVGQDGNVYYGSGVQGSDVKNLGSATNYELTNNNIRAINDNTPLSQGPGAIPNVTRIDDPLAPASVASPPSNPNGVASATARPVLDEAAVRGTQTTIDNMPALLADLLSQEQTKYTNSNNAFDAQEQTQRGSAEQSTTTNTQNYDSNMMDSVRAGAKGLGGLMQILRGTGAEGWARDPVGTQTSKDIRTGLDTRKQNQTAVDSALSSFLTELKGKKKQNDDLFENNKRAVQRESDTELQSLFGKMAGYYGDAEMAPQRQEWMSKADALTPSIFQNSRSQVSNYDSTPVSVKAPEITAFAGPSKQDIGYDQNGGQIGSGIFTMAKPNEERRRKDPNAATMGA